MGATNAALDAIVAKAAAVSGIRYSAARLPDTIPASPAVILGTHRATYTPGNREVTVYTIPCRLYVERTTDDARTIATTNDLLDALVTAYTSGVTLAGTVTQCLVRGWNSDAWVAIGDAEYQMTEITIELRVTRTRTFTP